MNGKSCFVFLWVIIFSTKLVAQNPGSMEYNVWNLRAGDTSAVFVRMANLREAASLSAPIIDSLPCGSQVIIAELMAKEEKVKGIVAPWAKVRFQKGSAVRSAYLWLGLLAIGHYKKGEEKFFYGMEKITRTPAKTKDDYEDTEWQIGVKALKEEQLVDEKQFSFRNTEAGFSYVKLLGDMGLSNTTDVLRIQFGGEACGIPTYYFYYAWTGSKFLELPGKMEVGDAGVFYHTETMLFPAEPGGQPGFIYHLTEEGTNEDEKVDKKGEPVFKISRSRRVYRWDGAKARIVEEKNNNKS